MILYEMVSISLNKKITALDVLWEQLASAAAENGTGYATENV
jgi:hypothetical protein